MAETREQLQAMCHFIARLLRPGAPLVAAVLNPDYDVGRQQQNELMMDECRCACQGNRSARRWFCSAALKRTGVCLASVQSTSASA
jgi:hypothetical protein